MSEGIKKHNQLVLDVLGENKHMAHFLTLDKIKRLTFMENRFPISKLYVCEKCESAAYPAPSIKTSKGKIPTASCENCGHITLNPITLSEYYIEGYDLDGAGLTHGIEKTKERNVRNLIL